MDCNKGNFDHKKEHFENADALLRDLYGANTALELFFRAGKAREIHERELRAGRAAGMLAMNGKTLPYRIVERMVGIARSARELSYAPYSHFNVGAAILAEDRNGLPVIVSGCNAENAAYSPTACAEYVATMEASKKNLRRFQACAVVGGFDNSMSLEFREAAANAYVTPCGRCRQAMKEFEADPCMVIVAKDNGQILVTTLEFLLPAGFGPRNLGVDPSSYSRRDGAVVRS